MPGPPSRTAVLPPSVLWLLRLLSVLGLAKALHAWRSAVHLAVPPPEAVVGGMTEDGFVLGVTWLSVAVFLAVPGWLSLGRIGLFRFLAINAGLLSVVLALELLAVVGVVDYQTLALRRHAPLLAQFQEWSRPDQDIVGETQPDLARLMRVAHPMVPFALRTDQHGFRNPRTSDDPAVVCLGDSILFAGLVPEAQIATVRLAQALGESVQNISRLGAAPQDALAWFDALGGSRADQVVLQFLFEGNDLSDSKHWRASHTVDPERPWLGTAIPRPPRTWPQTGLRAALLSWLTRPLLGMAGRRSARWAPPGSTATTLYFLYDARWVRRDLDELVPLGALLSAARERIVAAGGQYGVVLVPTKLTALHAMLAFPAATELAPEIRDSGLGEAFATMCADQGLACLDTTSALRTQAQQGVLPYFPLDTHLNADGHSALVTATLPFIARLRASAAVSPP